MNDIATPGHAPPPADAFEAALAAELGEAIVTASADRTRISA